MRFGVSFFFPFMMFFSNKFTQTAQSVVGALSHTLSDLKLKKSSSSIESPLARSYDEVEGPADILKGEGYDTESIIFFSCSPFLG